MLLYEKGSFGYFLELARKDRFDNIQDWNEWRKKNGKMRSNEEYLLPFKKYEISNNFVKDGILIL